jgi:hypothetical protein
MIDNIASDCTSRRKKENIIGSKILWGTCRGTARNDPFVMASVG